MYNIRLGHTVTAVATIIGGENGDKTQKFSDFRPKALEGVVLWSRLTHINL